MNPKRLQPVEILLVEDSPTDVLLAKEALEYSKVVNNLHVVSDGVEAMAFLRRDGKHKEAPRPGLILLDLNLPKKDGREVLAEIKNDEKLKRIPVVVLTTSKSEADVLKAYGLHANCYIVKPVDFEKFAEVVKYIENFWFSIVTLPGEQ
jgi:chemotaxis family two-component system response regulator Rcp1